MINLQKNELIGLPVYTQSGQYLGKVSDFELEATSQTIVRYHIRSKDIIKELLQKELLISKEQVVSLSSQKMIVEDNVIREEETKKAAFKKAVPVS